MRRRQPRLEAIRRRHSSSTRARQELKCAVSRLLPIYIIASPTEANTNLCGSTPFPAPICTPETCPAISAQHPPIPDARASGIGTSGQPPIEARRVLPRCRLSLHMRFPSLLPLNGMRCDPDAALETSKSSLPQSPSQTVSHAVLCHWNIEHHNPPESVRLFPVGRVSVSYVHNNI